MKMNSTLDIVDLGLIPYKEGIDLQNQYVLDMQASKRGNTLLLMEHHPTVTVGRTSNPNHLLQSIKNEPEIEIINTDRGGQITFHGPGQLVTYPLINIKYLGGPLKYIRTLESIIISVLNDLEIKSQTIEGLTGVWVNDAKIAAIGVKISKGIDEISFPQFVASIFASISPTINFILVSIRIIPNAPTKTGPITDAATKCSLPDISANMITDIVVSWATVVTIITIKK